MIENAGTANLMIFAVGRQPGEEDACGKWKAEERKSCRND